MLSAGSWLGVGLTGTVDMAVSPPGALGLSLNSTQSQGRPDAPRRELLLADAAQLALGLLAARHRQHLLEDPPAHLLHRRARQDHARVDVHVVGHVLVQ